MAKETWGAGGTAVLLLLTCRLMYGQQPTPDDWEDNPRQGVLNLLLGTDQMWLKLAVFTVIVIAAYVLTWLLFRHRIGKMKSPARVFFQCFFCFMLSVWLAAFICFSEYTLLAGYDAELAYLAQLNWTLNLIILMVWLALSLLTSFLLRGKS